MNVADDLVIFWNTAEGQEEVAGLYLYGLMRPDTFGSDLAAISAAWKPVSVQCQASRLESRFGPVLLVAVKFDELPEARDWKSILDTALTQLLRLGAIVVWAGGEDCTWSPDVLDPESGTGNVLAAKCSLTGFLCNANLDESIEFLDDSQLGSLWSFVKTKTAGQAM